MKKFLKHFKDFMKPAPSKPPITDPLDFIIKKEYKKNQEIVFWSAVVGYTLYYFVRKQWSLLGSQLMEDNVLEKGMYGLVGIALGVAYRISKFVMGTIGDSSNAKKFLAFGLLISAILNICLGLIWINYHNNTKVVVGTIVGSFMILFLVGWFQGMAWPAIARSMSNWFTPEKKQIRMVFWNTSHNFGSALAAIIAVASYNWLANSLNYTAFTILPSVIAILGGILILIFMPDTPQSKGLPSIEATSKIKKYTGKEIIVEESPKGYKYYFFKYVLFNKWIWIIASANFFIYVLRNGISDWMLKFLSDEHDFKLKQKGKWIWSLYEWGAIPGTIIIGFTANRYFKGKLTPLMIVAILITTCAIVGIWLAPYKNIPILAAMFAIAGFFIYGSVAFIGMQAMDFSHKKVVGTAAGLTGIFGYLGDTIGSKIIIGYGTTNIGNNYNATFIFLIICGISACLLLAFVWGKSYTLYKTNK